MTAYTWFNLVLITAVACLTGCAGNIQDNERKLRQVELGMIYTFSNFRHLASTIKAFVVPPVYLSL